MQNENDTPKHEDPPQPMTGEGRPEATCSRDLPFESPTPHAALEKVIDWLGIGYESTVTRRSDGKKITIRITGENSPVRASEE
jgi:hypothetical protein